MTRNWAIFLYTNVLLHDGETKGIGQWSSLSAVTAPVFHFIEDCSWAPGMSPQDRSVSSELDMTTAPSAFFFFFLRYEMKGRSCAVVSRSLEILLGCDDR